MSDEATPAPEAAEIDAVIEQLQRLKGEGVTHVLCRNRLGQVCELRSVGPERSSYDDGARLAIVLEAHDSPGTGPRDNWGRK